MYLVVSRWEAMPGKEAEFEEKGRTMRRLMRSLPGVAMTEAIRTEKGVLAVHGYESEDAYNRIVQDEAGPFAKALAEHRLEEVARWVGSEKGEALGDE